MRSIRRAILLGAALKALSGGSRAAFTAVPDLVVEAAYRAGGMSWRLALFSDYSAKLNVEFERMTIGTVSGQFRFYDNEVVDSQQLAKFARLRAVMAAPQPDIHPWVYEVALLLPNSGGLHRVKVFMGSSMPVSAELRVFFAIWRNIWSAIPGAPSAPTGYTN